MQVQTLTCSEWGGWKENGVRKWHLKNDSSPFLWKERCPHLRIIFLPRSFWQRFSILTRNTWACHFSFSLGVHIWPSPPPSPYLIHRTCISCGSHCCSVILGNTKIDWYMATDPAEFSLYWLCNYFWIMLLCTCKHTPIRGQSEHKTSSRGCNTDEKFYGSSQAACGYLLELKYSCKISRKRENLSYNCRLCWILKVIWMTFTKLNKWKQDLYVNFCNSLILLYFWK